MKRQYCSVAEPECVNPPGYMCGGGAFSNPSPPRVTVTCVYCGAPVCAACRVGKRGAWLCTHHTPEETEPWS